MGRKILLLFLLYILLLTLANNTVAFQSCSPACVKPPWGQGNDSKAPASAAENLDDFLAFRQLLQFYLAPIYLLFFSASLSVEWDNSYLFYRGCEKVEDFSLFDISKLKSISKVFTCSAWRRRDERCEHQERCKMLHLGEDIFSVGFCRSVWQWKGKWEENPPKPQPHSLTICGNIYLLFIYCLFLVAPFPHLWCPPIEAFWKELVDVAWWAVSRTRVE